MTAATYSCRIGAECTASQFATGCPPRPRITKTWAALSRAELREDDSGLALELDVGHPEGRLDPHTVGLSYYLQIETFGWILGDVSGVVRVVPREELGLTPAQYAQPDIVWWLAYLMGR